ncbi:hypothetical protein [Nonomuraea wenchangensis]|uniref:hypothetical protein n=1 Tax=Nonomuraea wenchangensis TaxID=568860 RepID=UPI00332AD868
MATKTVDVTLASIKNTNHFGASPVGVINAKTVRAIDDEEVFQNENLYLRLDRNKPMHSSGATFIPAGKSLTYNVTKRLTVSHEGLDSTENQMLMLAYDLTDTIVVSGQAHEVIYQGSFNHTIHFDDIIGFQAITLDYNAIHFDIVAKILVNYTVDLVS